MEVRKLFETLDYGPSPESPESAREWLKDRGNTLDHFIAGEWTTPDSGEYFASHNPATGEMLAMVADANEEDVNRAVASAADALEGWVAIGGHGRARFLYAMARRIQKNSRLFSVLESLDNGKPVRVFGDLNQPYLWVTHTRGLRVIRDDVTVPGTTKFYVSLQCGGKPGDTRALRALRLAE